MNNRGKIFLSKRVEIEKIVKEHQNCMRSIDDFESYVKYLRILESKVKKKEFTKFVNEIAKDAGGKKFGNLVSQIAKQEINVLSEQSAPFWALLGAGASKLVPAPVKGLYHAIASPVKAAIRMTYSTPRAVRQQIIRMSEPGSKAARNQLKNFARPGRSYPKGSLAHAQQKVAQQARKRGKKAAVAQYNSGVPAADRVSSVRELKAIARNPSNPNARLADDALDHGRAVSTRFYNSNAPSLAKHGARGALSASPMTAGGGWAVAGFLIDAAAAAWFLDRCTDKEEKWGLKWNQFRSPCCKDEEFQNFDKHRDGSRIGKECIDQIMKYCGEEVMPYCNPENKVFPEGFDVINCKFCHQMMTAVSRNLKPDQSISNNKPEASNLPGQTPQMPPAQGTPGQTNVPPQSSTPASIVTGMSQIPDKIKKVLTGNRENTGCIQANSAYKSAQEVADDLLCLYSEQGSEISKELVVKAICNTNFIKKLQDQINSTLGVRIPVTGKIDSKTGPLLKKLIGRLRPRCRGSSYTGQRSRPAGSPNNQSRVKVVNYNPNDLQ